MRPFLYQPNKGELVLKYVVTIELPEGIEEDIAEEHHLTTDPDKMFCAVQVIYAMNFSRWLDDKVAGGFASAFDVGTSFENTELFFNFSSKAEVEAFIAEFRLEDKYMVLEDA